MVQDDNPVVKGQAVTDSENEMGFAAIDKVASPFEPKDPTT